MDSVTSQYGYEFNEDAVEGYSKNGGTPWLYHAHTVFGQVYDGMDVVDAIAATKTDEKSAKPLSDVTIEKIIVSDYEK